MSSSELATEWLATNDAELTLDDISTKLEPIRDDQWVVTACVDRVLDDVAVQRGLLELGLKRTERACERAKEAYDHPDEEDEEDVGNSAASAAAKQRASLESHFRGQPAEGSLCYLRTVLLARLDRLNTFVNICKILPAAGGASDEEPVDQEWEDDPWGDGGEGSGEQANPAPASSQSIPPLSQFLTEDLLYIAYLLATQQAFAAVHLLLEQYHPNLWSYRFAILERIPEHAHPSDYRDLLPVFDPTTNLEAKPEFVSPREPDWSELEHVSAVFALCQDVLPSDIPTMRAVAHNVQATLHPLSSDDLARWYERRVDDIMTSTGIVDIPLSLIQHGASQGIPGLDGIGEELSLMSRLIYDTHHSAETSAETGDWTLARWRSMDPPTVVRAYLAHSSPASLPRDIRTLVMPYLFVLEARAERSGAPDPDLPRRLLYDYLLTAPLPLAAAVFEASKPTLPAAERLIRDDEDIARLALACLYGSSSLDQWPTMSRIFECLPAWDINRDDQAEEDEADATITALGAFVTPTTARPVCTAADLLVFFRPLPLASLSRALDILDVHLESGEILARWDVPAPLRWFLQSRNDEAEQRKWANRMARRAGAFGERLDTQDVWEELMNDMLKLAGSGEAGLRGAFGLLSRDEVIRIFFSGLLSAGDFGIAKGVLRSSKHKLELSPGVIEEICLACSREFYDNASSGNYKFGDMKLAYDCLDLPPPSENLIREKEFIEATSRICSFNVMSRPGLVISPIEIRLTKDRLSLVSRVLSSNAESYKHTQVILELVHKLGFRNDKTAEVKALAMIADTALQAEDFTRAYETSERMVQAALDLRASAPMGFEDAAVQEALEVCWVACYQLGRQSEFDDVGKKLSLLGRALELCPADRIPDILNAWRRLEQEHIDSRQDKASRRAARRAATADQRRTHFNLGTPVSAASAFTSRLGELHMPSLPASPLLSTPDAAALASKTFSRVAANFPFAVGRRDRSADSRSGARDSSTDSARRARPESGEMTKQASRALHKGIGWLIGADDE